LKYIAEKFRDDLLATPEISQVAIAGLPNLEFSIEVSETDMRRYGLTFSEISSAISEANINISGGKFDTRDEEILIRAWGRDYYAPELNDIVIRGNADGTSVYLRDVAIVKEKWEDVPDKTYYNNQPALVLNIDQTESEDIIQVANVTKQKINEFNDGHEVVKAKILDDRTIPLRQRIELLIKNGLIGLVMIVFALGIFLKLRLSFWVAVAIPFSFAGMFIVAGFWGITINVISLFGMILVVGILVDDGIVVAENIFSHFEKGKGAFEAAIDGTMEVIAPVTTSVLTTVIAFIPFFFLDGRMGLFMWQMALVVIFSLLFSLVEAFFVLPSHLAHSKALSQKNNIPRIRVKIDKYIQYLTHRMYAPTLRFALRYKYLTLMTPVALVLFTYGLLGGGIIGVTYFPFIDGDTIPVNVSLVSGRQEADTDALLARIENVVWQVNEEFKEKRPDGKDVILGIERDIGSNEFGDNGSHTGMLTIQLIDGEIRDLQSYVISNRIRELVGSIPEAQKITFGRVGHFGKPVSISLLGSDLDELAKASKLLRLELENYNELKDVTDTELRGRREVNISLKPRAHALGLTLRDIAGQVRQGFFGQEIQRIQRGRDEIRVWVRYKDSDRSSLNFLDQMRIRTPQGAEYPFSELADYSIERGVIRINHLERKREIKVEANLSNMEVDLPPILEEIELAIIPNILSQVHGVTASFEGQSRDQAKSKASMAKVFPVALLGMFILVVLVFRSYIQAILIFSLIPIGILGAIWGHGIQGLQLNILSLFGIIALSGIIINDSIVLIDKVNRNLRNGMTVYDSVYNAGLSRLRPILLTTFTTSFGLAPLIMETSRQAQFLIPMAVSVAYGLIFGTFILLIILPTGYMVINSMRFRVARFFIDKDITPELVEPAVKEKKLPAI